LSLAGMKKRSQCEHHATRCSKNRALAVCKKKTGGITKVKKERSRRSTDKGLLKLNTNPVVKLKSNGGGREIKAVWGGQIGGRTVFPIFP